MTIPAIFETSRPREDVRKGAIAEADFAADLAQVVTDRGGTEYLDPARFFARRYPTQGLRNLLSNVGGRLTGVRDEATAIFRLDTSYGGGKTHRLIAPVDDAARGMRGVAKFIGQILVLFLSALLIGCVGGNATSISGNAQGGAGIDVDVYHHSVPAYITPATVCETFYGSCPMGVIIPIGSACYCPSFSGPIWGQSR